MARQIKIKDIARMAGVSAGTVDRILHNRGNVSATSRNAVEKVLSETGYKYNIHTSAVSLKKEYRLVIAIPTAVEGEYWGSILTGINHALEEYSDIKTVCSFAYYNQFDIYSCRSAFDAVLNQNPDAVIIGGTFRSETQRLCSELDKMEIPYAFVDAMIEGTNPVVSYSSDQFACGYLVAKLLHTISGSGSNMYAILGTRRIGDEKSQNSIARKNGFISYFTEKGLTEKICEGKFSAIAPSESQRDIEEFLNEHTDVKGITVMNSRGYIVADTIRALGKTGISVFSFDLTSNNIRCINNGSITAVICQRPELQGFHAVKSLIRYLLYKQKESVICHNMPIDIIMKDNLPYYKEIFDV